MAIYAEIDGTRRAIAKHNVGWLADSDIPVGTILFPIELFDTIFDYQHDLGTNTWILNPFFDLTQYKKEKTRRLKQERDRSLYAPFTSSVTGTAFVYDLDALERNEIVARKAEGVNGKVECGPDGGVIRRRNHSAAEISALVTDMIAAIDAVFAAYETRIDVVNDPLTDTKEKVDAA